MPLTNEQLMTAAGLTPEQSAAVTAGTGYTPTTNSTPGTVDVSTLTSNPTVTPVVQPAPTPVIAPTPSIIATPAEIAAQKTSEDIQKLNEANVGQTEYRTAQETAVGLPELRKTQTDLASRLAAINAEAKSIPLALQNEATGQGITTGGLAPIQASKLRENAINALTTSALLEASRGNLTTALDQVDRAVVQKFGPIQEAINAKLKNLDMILKSPDYTIQEKNRAQAQIDLQNVNNAKVEQDKTNMKDVANLAFSSINNSSEFKPAIVDGISYPTLARALSGITNAKNPIDAARIQSATGLNMSASDKLDLEYKTAQMNKIKSDTAAAVAADQTVSSDVLNGMLTVYRSTGVLPAFGMSGKSPLRAQFYAALGGVEGGQIVNEANTNKAIRTGLSTAYRTQQNQFSATQTSIKTLDQQLSLAKKYSDKVSRPDSPLVNKYLLSARTGVFGDPDTAALNNIVTTASYEFAKILAGSSASIAGATVSTANDAKEMLNAAMSKGQFNEVLALMQQESAFRLSSQKDTIDGLKNDMGNVGNLTTALTQPEVDLTSTFDNLFKQYGGK